MAGELANLMAPDPVVIEVHYALGVGYWAMVDGMDASIYEHDPAKLLADLGENIVPLVEMARSSSGVRGSDQ